MTTEKTHLKAKATNAIRLILQDYYCFRLYIKFNNDKVMTIYGHENTCTYSQCVNGHISRIEMSPLRGYTALINYVERTKKDQYKKAVIYQRLPGAATFENICRRYYKGDVEEINDPVLSEADDYQLDYQVINGRVIIKNGDTLPGEELPDFKNEINNSLNKK